MFSFPCGRFLMIEYKASSELCLLAFFRPCYSVLGTYI
nr:MAG TPA: hypothetical protein [Caudoviricetes sp.]